MDQGVLTETLVAWVDGMKVVVQGTNSADENNVIILPAPPSLSNRVDFVFLEVWRKLITPDDVIYTHGNVLYGGVNYPNDLIDPAVNVETSLRIQVQYRIRVAPTDIESYPEGFDPNRVFAQGPLSNPLSCSSAAFVQVPGDPGLWRAGVGDSASQTSLQTVDGYTYAIPMFAVARRNTSAYNSEIHTNGAGYTLQDYLNGIASDRPDNLYSDWVVADDILDLRKSIKSDNLADRCKESFEKLISGKYRSKMNYQTTGEDRFSVVSMEIDGISYDDPGWFNLIGLGDNATRAFSLAYLPEKVLESRRSDSTVALPVVANSFKIHGSSPVVTTDGTFSNIVTNKGTTTTTLYDFGVQITYNTPSVVSGTIVVPRKIMGYEIIGVVSVYIPSLAVYGTGTIVTVSRNSTSYTINYTSPLVSLGANVQLQLYVGASDINPNFPGKYFQTNKQGKAITDTFQMIELPAVYSGSGYTYYVDSPGQVIYNIGSNQSQNGNAIAYDAVGNMITATSLGTWSTDKTQVFIDFASDPPAFIPVLTEAAVSNVESYEIYYQTIPYQGILDSTTYGTLETEGVALTTTAGSGTITNYTYSDGVARFYSDTTVTGIGVDWLSNAKAGYYICTGPDSSFLISSVISSTSLTLREPTSFSATVPYSIVADDMPSFSPANIINRLPALYDYNDFSACNEFIETAVSDPYPVLESRIISRPQDILTVPSDGVEIGVHYLSQNTSRGRSAVHITDSSSLVGLGNLGLKFEKITTPGNYQKTYQTYVLNKEDKGELYLMVVGSETDNLSASRYLNQASDNDTVDLFQMVGRPIKNGKII
jgi:hypothetical protein